MYGSCLAVHHHHHHQSLNREGRWGTTDDFATQFSPFFPVLHCPLGLGELQACPFPDVVFPPLPLSALSSSPLSLCLARWFWPDLMNGRHDQITAVCVSLRSSGDLRVVQLSAGSWHGLPPRAYIKSMLCALRWQTWPEGALNEPEDDGLWTS